VTEVPPVVKVGTIETLSFRVYPLDAELGFTDLGSTVAVQPGVYDVVRDGLSTAWIMTGRLNRGGLYREGDGLFLVNQGDQPSGIEVTVPSRRYGPDEWAEFLADPMCQEGHPEQRLRITMFEPAATA